jgi:hypothetical protein
MPRPRDKVPSERVRIDGYLKRGVDPQVDALLNWLDSLPPRKRFPMVMRRLMMGGVIETVTEDGDVEAARKAASEIIAAFVVDD